MVESGVDIRLVDGLASLYDLTVFARRIVGGVEVSHPPASDAKVIVGPASRLAYAWATAKLLWRERRNFDTVVVQGYSVAALAANVLGRLTGTPTTMLVCSPTERYYECRRANPQPGKPYRRREILLLRMIARLNALIGRRYVALSGHLAEVVHGHGTGREVEVIPVYGVDTSRFHPPEEDRASLKRRLGLPAEGTIIFFSSRIAPEKDSETLLAAVRKVLDRGHDVWILHRSGGFRGFAEDAARYGLAERTIASDAVHPVTQLPELYQAADLCIQASREEGLGFSPLEALATEVPVIATSVGGLRETIVDGLTGWTYPVGDVDTLADRIIEVIENPEEAHARAAEGRRRVTAGYDSTLAFQQFRDSLPLRR